MYSIIRRVLNHITVRRVAIGVVSAVSVYFLFKRDKSIISMKNELTSILSICPADQRDIIEQIYKENGMVETVIHLADNIWDEETRRQADEAIQKRDTSSKYYKVLFEHFNIKEHFSQVDSHRIFIKKAYNRLREFVPDMTQHQAEVHDLSKYTFAQSVGYTARWVHMIDNECWQMSLKDHYCNEPHHPQYYEKNGEKAIMERKYLEESLIDMVASRWERQLKGEETVSNSNLVDFDAKYLSRYHEEDRKEVLKIIESVKNS